MLAQSSAGAGIASPRDVDFFETHVRPIFVERCLRCHGQEKQESGLRLSTQEGLLAGGDSGPAIVPGRPAESLLLEAIRYESLEMPPDGRLEHSEVAAIETWIASGARWPAGEVLRPAPAINAADKNWWSLQPVVDPPLPTVANEAWCRNEIDRFVLARLEAAGLEPANEEEPLRLARRVHFALTGLPPASQFVLQCETAPPGDDGYEQLVDRLLDDPAYGENQARFWLDLVRYAESDGYRADAPRPDAHEYRDYVIRSFNADKPYDRFVAEQLAGDEVAPGDRDAIIATMYYRHWHYEYNQRDVEGQWREILNDVTETTCDALLALGMKCARCHDHKFDPLLQQDYYRMQAFFAALLPREDMPVAEVTCRAEYEAKRQAWEAATDDIHRRLHEIETPALLKHATGEGFHKFVAEIKTMITTRAGERGPYEQQIASLASRQFGVEPEKLPEWLDAETQAEREQLLVQLAAFDSLKPKPLPTQRFVASDVGPVAPPTYVPGDHAKTPVEPGFPTVLCAGPAEIAPPPAALQSTGRRSALARWIVDPANPLTARVIVNRIWQQHFGRGLVETASDFGRLGSPPSHPQLLDWLASRFVEDGWSIKKLHRRILTSATYRQSSSRAMDDRRRELDPANVWLWRMNPRRLSGEEITDVLLAASGKPERSSRAIYQPVQRNAPDELMALFDFPDRIASSDQRHRTTTSRQALMLLNSPRLQELAAGVARSLAALGDEEFFAESHRRLLGRSPTEDERCRAREFCAAYAEVSADSAGSSDETGEVEFAELQGERVRTALVHALMMSNELVYVD